MKASITWLISVSVFMMAVVLLLAAYPASSNDDHHRTTTTSSSNNTGAAVLGTLLITCAIASLIRGQFCLADEKKPEPLPDFGPAVKNDVTPDNTKTKKLYVIEAQ